MKMRRQRTTAKDDALLRLKFICEVAEEDREIKKIISAWAKKEKKRKGGLSLQGIYRKAYFTWIEMLKKDIEKSKL